MIRKPWFWIALFSIGLLVAGFARLRFDVEVLNLLPDNVPAVAGLKLCPKEFHGLPRTLIITVRAADAAQGRKPRPRALAQSLRAETNLVASVLWQCRRGWSIPRRRRNLIGYLWLNQPPRRRSAS